MITFIYQLLTIENIPIFTAIIVMIINIYSLNITRQKNEMEIIAGFLKDVCIGMLDIRFLKEDGSDVDEKDVNNSEYIKDVIKHRDDLKNRLNQSKFYDGVRAFLGNMYYIYRDVPIFESDKLFYERAKHFSFEWPFLFEKFRRYEYLMGMKKSALCLKGETVRLSYISNMKRHFGNWIREN